MNRPISGSIDSERLSAPPVLVLDVDVTGIAITRVAGNFTVLVIVTDEGELAKVRFLTTFVVISSNMFFSTFPSYNATS